MRNLIPGRSRRLAALGVLFLALIGTGAFMTSSSSTPAGQEARSETPNLKVVGSGVSPSGVNWQLVYHSEDGEGCLDLKLNDVVAETGCGFGVPETTEIGFSGGLTPGKGDYYLYGVTTPRIETMVAESDRGNSTVKTEEVPSSLSPDGLRVFLIAREPVEDVKALSGLDREGRTVQRIALSPPPRS